MGLRIQYEVLSLSKMLGCYEYVAPMECVVEILVTLCVNRLLGALRTVKWTSNICTLL